MKRIAIIPALNPSAKLPEYADALVARGFDRIVVVDDGSGEAYRDTFRRLAANPHCTLLMHPENRGKGAALKNALASIPETEKEPCIVVTADADGQHLAEDCRRVADLVPAEGGTIVLGSRDFGARHVPFRSWFGNRLTSLLAKLVYGKWLPDAQTGLRAFLSSDIPMMLNVPGDRFEYETGVLVAAARSGMRFATPSIATIYEDGNRSSHFRPLRDTFRICRVIARDFVCFTLVSFSSFVLDQGLAWLFADFILAGMGVSATSAIWASGFLARLASSVYNFLLNKAFVFRTGVRGKTAAFRYAILCVGVICLSNASVTLLNGAGVGRGAAKAACDVAIYFLGYRLQEAWVFRKGKTK